MGPDRASCTVRGRGGIGRRQSVAESQRKLTGAAGEEISPATCPHPSLPSVRPRETTPSVSYPCGTLFRSTYALWPLPHVQCKYSLLFLPPIYLKQNFTKTYI